MRALIHVSSAVMLVAAIATGCAGEGPRLIIGEDRETGETVTIGVTLPGIPANKPQSLGSWIMCLDRPGTVTLEKVELLHPQGGIVLQAFSTRLQSQHEMLGNATKPLTELGFPATSPPITTACSAPGEDPAKTWPHTELGLQYANTGKTTARSEGIRLHYISAGEPRTADFSLNVELCAPKDDQTKSCREMYEALKDE